MRITTGISMVTLALALTAGFSPARAEEAKATGTISGKVVDADGKAIKGATVVAVPPRPAGEGRREGGGGAGAEGRREGGGAGAAGGGDRKPPEPLAKAETAEDGTYKLQAVPVGKVNVRAMLQGVGGGRSQSPVEVTAGQDTKVDDIKLAKRPEGGNRRGGGDQGGQRRGGDEGGQRRGGDEGKPSPEAKKDAAK
jgi:hypothetical protein